MLGESHTTLYAGPAVLKSGEDRLKVEVKVEYVMTPRPKPVIHARASSSPRSLMLIEADELALEIEGNEIPVNLTSSGETLGGDGSSWSATFSLARKAEIGEGGGIVRLEAGLVNFLHLHGLGRHRVITDDWTVELVTVPSFSQSGAWADLSLEGAYAETHRIVIEPSNGGAISRDKADDILQALHHFLSFVAGDRIGLVHPRGLDESGNTVWEVWGTPTSRKYDSSRLHWVDTFHWQDLGHALAGFMRIWESEVWREPFETALYWHLLSNRQGANVDGGVILSQAALELIAWVYLVQDRGLISKKGFNSIDAEDQLRLALSACRIPTSIPESLEDVRKALRNYTAPAGGAADGPHVFTTLRNAYVHPAGKRRIHGLTNIKASFEVWILGTWYTELLLLSLIGYQGVYANRCRYTRWIGEVEEVPWSMSA